MGQDAAAWKGILGRHDVGNCNENGCLLLEFCTGQQIVITNSIFQQKDSLKTIWIHPRSKHWHLIDYILARQRDLKDVLHTRVMLSAECHTDHRLVRCKLKMHFKPRPKNRELLKKKFKLSMLQSAEVKADFQTNLQTKLGNISFPENSSPYTL